MEYLVALLGLAASIFFGLNTYNKNKRKEAEAENLLNALKVDDAVLGEKQSNVDKQLNEKKPVQAEELTPEEAVKFWNNKDKK